MKLELEIERTFAGKQYENLKPKLKLSYEGDEVAPDIERESDKLIKLLEAVGKKWQEEQLGNGQGEQTS